jgi:hypothetical protein
MPPRFWGMSRISVAFKLIEAIQSCWRAVHAPPWSARPGRRAVPQRQTRRMPRRHHQSGGRLKDLDPQGADVIGGIPHNGGHARRRRGLAEDSLRPRRKVRRSHRCALRRNRRRAVQVRRSDGRFRIETRTRAPAASTRTASLAIADIEMGIVDQLDVRGNTAVPRQIDRAKRMARISSGSVNSRIESASPSARRAAAETGRTWRRDPTLPARADEGGVVVRPGRPGRLEQPSPLAEGAHRIGIRVEEDVSTRASAKHPGCPRAPTGLHQLEDGGPDAQKRLVAAFAKSVADVCDTLAARTSRLAADHPRPTAEATAECFRPTDQVVEGSS